MRDPFKPTSHRKPSTLRKRLAAAAAITAITVGAAFGVSALTHKPAAPAFTVQTVKVPAPAWQADTMRKVTRVPAHVLHITVPDNGVQPFCPVLDIGRHADITLAGTAIIFQAVCTSDGTGIQVWDEIP